MQVKSICCLGDSKTAGYNIEEYIQVAAALSGQTLPRSLAKIATGGWQTADLAANIDASLAAYSGTPDFCLINIGVNDFGETFDQGTFRADWLADMGYVLDALHTKWASTLIRVAQVWRQGYDDQAAILDDDYIVTAISGRSYCAIGMDERTFLPGGDDGATNTIDGTHPSTAGLILQGWNWIVNLGW